jgi:rhodanese-related sulfurtransferase
MPRHIALPVVAAALLMVPAWGCQNQPSSPQSTASAIATASHAGAFGASAADLKKRIDGGETITIVDTRGATSFAQEHIKGAINVPVDQIEQNLAKLPKDQTIALYCTCPAENTSGAAAQTLSTKHGYTKMLVIVGGMSAMKQAGFATAAGTP